MQTILLIEDNQSYRDSLGEILQMEGYMTLSASNGLAGLQMIREYLPKLIVCDVDMPFMNGLEVLRKVKADPLIAAIPFLILTAQMDGQLTDKLDDLGANALLRKPIGVEEFLNIIAHFLPQENKVS